MRIHLIAIGGSAMHNLALALAGKGYTVSGSDDEIYDPARSRLEAKGLLPEKTGWHPERITREIDVIILGMHARPDNPELKKAKDIGLTICSYPEYVFEQSKNKQRVVIGGSHGKTTTTAMVLHVLNALDRDVDYLVGAQLAGFDNMVRLTDAPLIVIEGDEYLSSPIHRQPKFWYYRPHIAVITGIAWDHINVFPTFEKYEEQFKVFTEKIEKNGSLIWFSEDASLKRITKSVPDTVRLIPYTTPRYIHSPKGDKIFFEKKEYPVKVFGIHNLQNLEAARLVCEQLGIGAEDFFSAIMSFAGAARRLELVGQNHHSSVFLDFAHAPSKVKATVAALKHRNPDRKLISVFELHTFSSLNPDFLSEYAHALDSANEALVFYSSHTLKSKKMPPLSRDIIKAAFARKDLKVFDNKEDLHKYLFDLRLKSTNLLLMSSGNFGKLDVDVLTEKILLD